MKVGDKAQGSNDEIIIHGATGIRVVKNDQINSRQKEMGYDTVEVHIIGENGDGSTKRFSICIFGKNGVQL